MTKIDIISGFLGAGKTTLIRKLLEGPLKGQKVVLIENEFGEIGIDGGFLKDSGIQINEMNSGCICCTLVGDFEKALGDVLSQYAPDRIIIEPSGVGKLSDVAAAVQPVLREGEVEMGCMTTVCDASKCRMYIKNFGEFYVNQLESAGTIVLSRTQNVSDKRLDEALKLIREHCGENTSIITTPWDDLTGEQIYDVMCADGHKALLDAAELYEHEEHHHHHHDGETCSCGHHHHDHDHEDDHDEHEHHHHDEDGHCCCGHHHHHHHDHDADEVFTSWGVETAKKFSKADIEHALTELDGGKYGMILRSKGIVDGGADGWLEFDYVPGEWEVRQRGADVGGKLVVIGSKLDEKAIAALFGC